MKTNKLPKDRAFRVTFLTETSAGIAGTTLTVQHDERGWHGIDGHGEVYELFAEHLRNPELCRVETL